MIKIPHNSAIKILEQRLRDVANIAIELEVLKARLKADVEAIFGFASTQSFTVIALRTSTIEKNTFFDQNRKIFKQTIEGFINYIKDFHLIEQERVEASEQEYKAKYLALAEKWNELVPEYNSLLDKHQALIKDYDQSLSRIDILTNKIDMTENISDVIKILFLGASPLNENRLRIDQELRDIENGLRLATLRDQFEIKSHWAVTSKTLQQAILDEKPSIVHFSGHGDTSGIALEDVLGNSKIVSNDALGSLFELFKDEINCVILNSCYSESQAREISKHVPYVIGMKSSISDHAALAFSIGFYAAMGAGKDIRFAFKMGMVAIKLEGITGNDLPVLIG